MRINEFKFKELVRLLTSEWADCATELQWAAMGEELPNIPTVYFVVSPSGRIEYIGQSKQLRVRAAQHVNNPKFMKELIWDRTFWIAPHVSSLPRRIQLETILIAAVIPRKNRAVMVTRTRFGTLAEIKFPGSRGPRGPRLRVKYRKAPSD